MSVRVIDASVVAAALLGRSPDAAWAEEQLVGAELVAPQLVLAEVTNVLRRAELAGRVEPLEAALAHEDLLRLRLTLYPYPPLAPRIWDLRGALTAYDAWYVALAEHLGAPLATLDRKLTRAPALRCAFVPPP